MWKCGSCKCGKHQCCCARFHHRLTDSLHVSHATKKTCKILADIFNKSIVTASNHLKYLFCLYNFGPTFALTWHECSRSPFAAFSVRLFLFIMIFISLEEPQLNPYDSHEGTKRFCAHIHRHINAERQPCFVTKSDTLSVGLFCPQSESKGGLFLSCWT